MILQSPQNPYSHLTVKDRKELSFPTRKLLALGYIKGRTLDFGSGRGIDTKYLQKKGFDVTAYDPYYSPDYPTGKFDTILCHYVLNVLLPEEQAHVLMAVSELLKPTGKAYFTVRRDIRRVGFRTHAKYGQKVYQCNVVLPFKSVFRTEHCEIYEYRHINQLTESSVSDCFFCHPTSDEELISESATVYAILDKGSLSPGHTLVIPKQHVTSYFELSERAKTACWLMVDRVRMLLTARFQPDGVSICIDVDTIVGHTIPHSHIHIVPRFTRSAE